MHPSRPAVGQPASVSDDLRRIVEARHHDPFAVLGRHIEAGAELVRAFIPHARRVSIVELSAPLKRIADTDVFEWRGTQGAARPRYRLCWEDDSGRTHTAYDPYCFPPQIGDLDLYLFGEGRHWHAYRFLGAHPHTVDGVDGVLFATWAPSAERVSVVGDFNRWDGRRHPMRVRGPSGVWELFVPGLHEGTIYKFEIRNRASGAVVVKTDPYGRQFERRPATAAIVRSDGVFDWGDADWLAERASRGWLHQPMSVYEVHLGSWRRPQDGEFYSYRELAHRVVDYLRPLGFTHIELLPVTEHPLDQSWGYQTTGYYAPTSRYGNPDDFRYFVDYCHRNGIGVLLDWPPAHFPKDAFALAGFDGSALYEHEDPRRGEHREWGTLIFNYGRNEVRNFLLSSALFWLEEFHIDGLRVDAVASMLYLDYSRAQGDWLPNIYGGRENLEAMAFLRELNTVVHEAHPGAVTVAEESTSWPMVSRPVYLGGLGFSMKWNMGWMHDTLKYMGKDPVYRHYHHDNLTFGLVYAFTENFVLPLSHDEVVHLKHSLLDKMPGDVWQRFANLRALYVYMFTYPGKKLLFMGGEFGQWREWQDTGTLEWHLLDYPSHRGVQLLVGDLNRLYRTLPALHRYDFEPQGFEWIDCHDSAQSVITYLRRAGDDFVLVALNLTPVPRFGYRIGVPSPGHYRELLNSDSSFYWGSDLGNGGGAVAEDRPWMGRPYSISVTLPPLAGLVFALS